jgi:gas vesicle protein
MIVFTIAARQNCHTMHNKTVSKLVLLMFSLVVGAALVLRFAPKTGDKIRHDLAKRVETGLRTGREAVEPAVKRVEKEFDEMQKNVEGQMQ